jgi:hypothetical protein
MSSGPLFSDAHALPPNTLAPSNVTLTRTQKLQAFFVKLQDPTSSPYLFSLLLLLDLLTSLSYCVCVSIQLSGALGAPLWLSGCWAFCALYYGFSGRRKWNFRREALRERRRRIEREGNEAERMRIQQEGEGKKAVTVMDTDEKREMVEV